MTKIKRHNKKVQGASNKAPTNNNNKTKIKNNTVKRKHNNTQDKIDHGEVDASNHDVPMNGKSSRSRSSNDTLNKPR